MKTVVESLCAACSRCDRWKSEVSELQQSLESRKQEYDKQSHLLDRMHKVVAYQKSEIQKRHAVEDNNRSLVSKTQSLEAQLKVTAKSWRLLL